MINECLNVITFYGDEERIDEALNDINSDSRFTTDNIGCNITMNQDGYTCTTNWEPNIAGAKRIADLYGLDFHLVYDEPGNEIFGEVNYNEGVLTIIELGSEDYGQIIFDEETELYSFRGKNNEYNSDFLITLLMEKACQSD